MALARDSNALERRRGLIIRQKKDRSAAELDLSEMRIMPMVPRTGNNTPATSLKSLAQAVRSSVLIPCFFILCHQV